MSYSGVGATTNFAYNYTLLSGGKCYDTIAKKEVAQSYCAGDVKAMQPGPLYAMRGGFCTNTATGKLADLKYCQPAKAPAGPSTFDKILDGFAIFGQNQAPTQAPSSGVSKYLLPLGLAAAGLGLVLIVTKPKRSSAPAAAPTSNPARRPRADKYRVSVYFPDDAPMHFKPKPRSAAQKQAAHYRKQGGHVVVTRVRRR